MCSEDKEGIARKRLEDDHRRNRTREEEAKGKNNEARNTRQTKVPLQQLKNNR